LYAANCDSRTLYRKKPHGAAALALACRASGPLTDSAETGLADVAIATAMSALDATAKTGRTVLAEKIFTNTPTVTRRHTHSTGSPDG
jgi:hypothetical protein